jgi:zona occludens toxin (predicted ATPase)
MNRVYYGKIGGGKTCCVIFQELIPALRAGRKVVTNIDGLNLREIRNYIGKEIDLVVKTSLQWWRDSLTCQVIEKEDGESEKVLNPAISEGALYIIDECQMIWDAREFKDTKKGFLNLIEYNRHFGIDIVFVTQNVKRCDVNISRLANDSYQIKNLGFLHSFTKNRFAVNRRQTPFDKDVISQYTRKYDPVIFTLYKSGVDANAVKQKSKFSAYLVMPVVLLFIFCVVMLVKQGNPIAAISKHTGVKNADSSNNISGLPVLTYSKNPIEGDSSSHSASPPKNTQLVKYSVADLESRCINAGFVKSAEEEFDPIELVYYDCFDALVIVRNGKIDRIFRKSASSAVFSASEPFKINPAVSGAVSIPSASPALAEGGRGDTKKVSPGDLVYNANKSNTFIKNK